MAGERLVEPGDGGGGLRQGAGERRIEVVPPRRPQQQSRACFSTPRSGRVPVAPDRAVATLNSINRLHADLPELPIPCNSPVIPQIPLPFRSLRLISVLVGHTDSC